MTDDLVKRLRNTGEGDLYFVPYTTRVLIDAAANRIDELEGWLRLIAEHPVNDSKQWEVGCKEMKKVARLALGEKKDD